MLERYIHELEKSGMSGGKSLPSEKSVMKRYCCSLLKTLLVSQLGHRAYRASIFLYSVNQYSCYLNENQAVIISINHEVSKMNTIVWVYHFTLEANKVLVDWAS